MSIIVTAHGKISMLSCILILVPLWKEQIHVIYTYEFLCVTGGPE
jgi:hypothetical protein